MKKMYDSIVKYLIKHPPAYELFEQLLLVGDLYLIGGILREYRDKGDIENLRDADFVIQVKNHAAWRKLLTLYATENNRFGGYKLKCSGLLIDIWELENTWAFQHDILTCKKDEYLTYLPQTVFLNIDSIIYDINNDIWYDEIYVQAMQEKVLDVVLKDNPFITLNIIRAMILRMKYQLKYSNRLREIFLSEVQKHKDIVYDLLEIQINRYGEYVLLQEDIERELQICKTGIIK